MAIVSLGCNPSRCKPAAYARTISVTWVQVHVCQIPRSLCRNAGRLPNCAAFRRSNLGNVSSDSPPSAMSVSAQKPARWFAPAYGDLRLSGSSHASSAHFSSQYKGSKVLQAQFGGPGRDRLRINEKVGGIRCELDIGDGWGALSQRKSLYVRDFKRRETPTTSEKCSQQRTFVSSCISDPPAHARPDEAAPGTPMADDLLLASSRQRQRTSQNLVFKPRRSHHPNRSLLRSNRLGP